MIYDKKLKGKNSAFLQGLRDKYHLSDEDTFLMNRVVQWAENSRQGYVKKFTGFLDKGRQFLLKTALDSVCCKNYMLYGGYENAERKMLCVFSEQADVSLKDFPMKCLEFSHRRCDETGHRDVLGSLMALGITRDSIGDIIIKDDHALAMVSDTASVAALESIRKIGRTGVKVSEYSGEIIPDEKQFDSIQGTVSSLRLDCILGMVLRLSREKALCEVKSGKVTVNCFIQENPAFILKEKDEFSVRGYGKFIVDTVGNVTKKGKFHINVLKYI